MNITYRLALSFSLLLIHSLPAMDTDPSPEQAVEQAIIERNWGHLALLDPSATLINKVFIATKMVTGELVKLSPLLHAVYTRNAHMVGKLLAHGASPVGKLDTAPQLTTPLQEAIKLDETQIITELKNAWIALVQKTRKNIEELTKLSIKNFEDHFAKQDWYAKQPASQNLHIDTDQVDRINFSNAVIANDIQKLQHLVLFKTESTKFLANEALIKTTLASGENVEISPLAYAVYTQNAQLVQTLLELGAFPLGKWDTALQLATPLQEARKSGNTVLINILRNASLAFLKKTSSEQIDMIKYITDPANKDACAISHQVWGLDDEKLALARQKFHLLYDQEKLLELCTIEELDQYIDLEDLITTNNFISYITAITQKAITEAISRTIGKLSLNEHKNQ